MAISLKPDPDFSLRFSISSPLIYRSIITDALKGTKLAGPKPFCGICFKLFSDNVIYNIF
jgi:hypothetical protein